mgnify:CR=1 FL=1
MFLVIFFHCYRYSTNIIVMTSHTVPQNRHKFRQKIDTSPSTKFQYKDMGVLVRSNDPYISDVAGDGCDSLLLVETRWGRG